MSCDDAYCANCLTYREGRRVTEPLYQLAYKPGAHDDRFAMPRPDDFELVACDEEGE